MDRDVGGLRPPAGRERAAAVGLVLVAAMSPQVGAAFGARELVAIAMVVAASAGAASLNHR